MSSSAPMVSEISTVNIQFQQITQHFPGTDHDIQGYVMARYSNTLWQHYPVLLSWKQYHILYLQEDLDDACYYGELVEIHGSKNFNSLVKQLLNVAE